MNKLNHAQFNRYWEFKPGAWHPQGKHNQLQFRSGINKLPIHRRPANVHYAHATMKRQCLDTYLLIGLKTKADFRFDELKDLHPLNLSH